MNALKTWFPLGLVLVLTAGFWAALRIDPQEIPSPMIDKPVPEFELPLLEDASQTVSNGDLWGEVMLLNVWASWCVSCRAEMPSLVAWAKDADVPLYGVNFRDDMEDATRFLKAFDFPFRRTAFDSDGKLGLALGVYGTPETYLIDKFGVIRYKHAAPISEDSWETVFLPKIAELKAES